MKSFRESLAERSALGEGKYLNDLLEIFDDEANVFNSATGITDRKTIPSTTQIPIESPTSWLRIPDVIACFVDMESSTKLSATSGPSSTAKAYRYFTNTAVRIFHRFDCPYIDVRGDRVFALFDSHQPHTALAATVTFKSFVEKFFRPKIKRLTDLNIGGHFGIDMKTVLVRRLGLKSFDGRTDRQNEVWAGKPINMAAKLASRSSNGELCVSDRYYKTLKGDKALQSCGCGTEGQSSGLWAEIDVSEDERFDFERAWVLKSNWCSIHGKQYCKEIIGYDEA